MKFALRGASRPLRAAAGPALVVAPHPDDETLGCGGYIATAAQAGRRVEVVFLTDGEASHPGHPGIRAGQLASIRRAEALAALACLGLPESRVRFLGLPDGRLDKLPAEVLAGLHARLADLLAVARPAEVLAPYRQGGSTEHTAATQAVVNALETTGGGRLLEYPIWGWWNPFRLRHARTPGRAILRLELGPLRSLKLRALDCHASQVRPADPWPEPVLPRVLAKACCGPDEFFFASDPGAARS